ncbi:hypothetical protein LQL77_23025 [Rhodococcus cerastii]|nr:hypothetical protein [Rhodococcus cerastii]
MMSKEPIARDGVGALFCALVMFGVLERPARRLVAPWAWMIVIVAILAVTVHAAVSVSRARHLSSRSRRRWRAVVMMVPVAGPLVWFVVGDNPVRREWILIPVIVTAVIVFGGAIALSVQDYGWPTEPPRWIEIFGRTR